MKKITSIPSTRPQQFLYTDFSIRQFPSNPKHSLNKILNFLKNILQFRTYLSKHDFEQLWTQHELFLREYLDMNSMSQLWDILNKNKDDRLQQRQILTFLTKLVMGMTKLKNHYAKSKLFDKMAQIKSVIERFQENIIEIQSIIRLKIKEKAVNKMMKNREEREKQFKKEEQRIKDSLEENKKNLQIQIHNKNMRQRQTVKKIINDRAENQLYIYKPSKKLQLTKEQSLLTKLAPYKNEKKRPFQCKSLQKSLDLAIDQEKKRIQADITHFKQTERDKLKRKQQLEHECYLTKLKSHNDEVLTKLSFRKDQLNKAQNIKIHKLVSQNDKAARDRVRSLQNSLKAYSQRDQSTKIRQIMENHRQTIQHVNNVEQIADITIHDQFSPRYSTINMDTFRERKKKKLRYSELRTQRKILRKVQNQQNLDDDEDIKGLYSARKSLVDMYNQELEEVK